MDKALKILELCLRLNPTPTERVKTGTKPTVFCNFSGHVSLIYVTIHDHGWTSGNDATDTYYYYLGGDRSVADKIIDRLEALCGEWCDD